VVAAPITVFTFKQSYRLLGAGIGWFAVLSQYWLCAMQFGPADGGFIFFSVFTVLGNMLVAAAFTVELLPIARFLTRPGVRTAAAVYILVVAVVYNLLLRKVFDPTGFGAAVNVLLHDVMPTLYLLDWAMFVPKRGLTYRQIPFWLIFPLLYAAVTMLDGALLGYYPYPFLNAARFGYAHIGVNIAMLTGFFVLASAGFVALGRAAARGKADADRALRGQRLRGG
jgi:hypothetical protein